MVTKLRPEFFQKHRLASLADGDYLIDGDLPAGTQLCVKGKLYVSDKIGDQCKIEVTDGSCTSNSIGDNVYIWASHICTMDFHINPETGFSK